MFRLWNRNDRKRAISKGSEFRTSFLLATCKQFSECHFNANFSPRQMNKFLKEPKQYTAMSHARHLRASETNNTQ
jgi:hypothetical protein